MVTNALIVDDDEETLQALEHWIRQRDVEPTLARSLEDARHELHRRPIDVAIVDVHLPDGNGMDLQTAITPRTDFVLVSGDGRFETVREALRRGALDYLLKPLDLGRLAEILARRGTIERDARDGDRHPAFGPFVGESPAMERAFLRLCAFAAHEDTVFVHGESGTGKELAARLVHERSPRSRGPFEAINCGALSRELVESELFGHEKGSFTGADRRHAGAFERAGGGTLFLDEVTEMPLDLQVKLLRVLETGVLHRVGGRDPVKVDARIVAASNRDPARMVSRGELRPDLFHRLHVLPLHLPPLRERGRDSVHIARNFIDDWNRVEGTSKRLSRSAEERVRLHPWPGNVRELKNVVRRAHVLSEFDEIRAEDVHALPAARERDPFRVEVGMSLAEAERRLVLGTLLRYDGDKAKTAEVLGVSLKTIYNRLHVYADAGDELLPPNSIRTRQDPD